MNFAAQYCSMRRDLEERGWHLTSLLAETTTKLMQQIGSDPQVFVALRIECGEIRIVLQEAHHELQRHRLEHGC